MRCPQCEKEGLRSKVFPGVTTVTLLNHEIYFDEDGSYHCHDPNVQTQFYKCSNGHRWHRIGKDRCPVHGCTYGGDWKIVLEGEETHESA